jgi:hypothetical protein
VDLINQFVLATVGVLITCVVTGLFAAWVLDFGLPEGMLAGAVARRVRAQTPIPRTGGRARPQFRRPPGCHGFRPRALRSRLAKTSRKQGITVVGVDFAPEVGRAQQNHGLDARFGDGEAPDHIESLLLADLPWIVSPLADYAANCGLIDAPGEHHFQGNIAVVARDAEEARRLASLRRIEVLHPFKQAAGFAAPGVAAGIASSELTEYKETS